MCIRDRCVLVSGDRPSKCAELDNLQLANNPVYSHADCEHKCSLCFQPPCGQACDADGQPPGCSSLGGEASPSFACAARACPDSSQPAGTCEVDGFVGSELIAEDELQRTWNFTLAPGAMTSMHRHDFDYSFVAIQPSQLEVYGEDGKRLFDFYATGLSLRVQGEYLVPTNGMKLPWKIPRVHAARNIGRNWYYEILIELKTSTNNTDSCSSGTEQA
eukprot:TRINITY_DN1365_c0_g1_i1.p1 TRINITY_DN1365_c0_g1~~TRINITY_DN1365_c0_g1_i1.p1  ORF type:complete len:217 (+),score=50.34 TRINITY_DN1365_c0_g1_i1:145-795(+)